MSGCPSRARAAIGAVFPHRPHWRWRRGSSRRRQTSHTALPSSSNPAAGLTLPQVAQGRATCPAPLAHPAAVTAEQRPAGPPADRARRDGQGSRAPGDQLEGQPAGDRRRSGRQRPGISSQRVREPPQGLPARGDRVDRVLDHRRRP